MCQLLDAADEHTTLHSTFAAMGRSDSEAGVPPDVVALLHMILHSTFAAMSGSNSEAGVPPDVKALLRRIVDSTCAAMSRSIGNRGPTPLAGVVFVNPQLLQMAI